MSRAELEQLERDHLRMLRVFQSQLASRMRQLDASKRAPTLRDISGGLRMVGAQLQTLAAMRGAGEVGDEQTDAAPPSALRGLKIVG